LVLRFAWVAALPLLLVALLVWLLLLPHIRADIEVRYQTLARAVAGQVEMYLLSAQHQLTAITGILEARGQRPSTYWFVPLDAHVGAGEVFETIYIVNSADVVHSVGLPETQRQRREDLLNLDLSRRSFLREARKFGEPVWSETFLSLVSGRLSVALAIPMAQERQVVIGEIAIGPLSTFLNQLPGDGGLLTMILDHRGQVIAHPELTLSGQQINLSHLPIVQEVVSDRFTTSEFTFQGLELIGSTVGVPKVGWSVLVAQERHEVFQPVTFTFWAMAVGLLAGLVLAALTGWILARDFARRIDLYTERAHAIANGDYEQPWPVSRIKEFAVLANDFQRMVAAIRQREQALMASETRFRDLTAMASDWFWEQDEQFRYTFFSSGEAVSSLKKIGTLIGKTRWELPIELTPAQMQAHRNLLEAHQPFRDLEYRIRLESGGYSWFHINGQPLFDATGRFSGYRGTGRDITHRKRAEERQILAGAVFDAALEAIVVTDIQWRIVAVNRALTGLTGYSETEILGRYPGFLLDTEVLPGTNYRLLLRTLARQGTWRGEVHNRRRNGEHYVVLVTFTQVRDQAGQLTHFVGTATDITLQKEAEQHIKRLAYYDTLTHLPNRALLTQRAELALALAARRKAQLAVLFLDLDRFKEVNDALGHAEGDALLVQAAAHIKRLIRETDTACRLGGDEFVILLPDVGMNEARQAAERLSATFRQPFAVAGHSLRVTLSIGIALYPADGTDFDTLLKNADSALYKAKQAGRNTLMFYDREMNSATFGQLVLESQLREAIDSDQLLPYFQPKVRLSDGMVIGAEALVRWHHPQRGLIPPGQFIPIAESSDLIVALGDWMLEAVCQQLVHWRQLGLAPVSIAVNLTARHFRERGFAQQLQELLSSYGLAPQLLELELTESALLEVGAGTGDTLLALQKLGVGLAIDDFGTGYSSLSYLKRLPITVLKIDQSFVCDLATDQEDRILAATIVTLGHSLGLKVVAEGVETEEQRGILLEQGCDFAQGYFFAPPMPAQAFTEWLSKTDSANHVPVEGAH
jgi:diguanylate cyclase (GGDEF)-like protein/PAS domain S-box-containing protein